MQSDRNPERGPMASDVSLSCSCGAVRGVLLAVTPGNSSRLSCMCDDCQIYAHFLGRAADILDASGGTDLSYTTQSRVRIAHGSHLLRAVKLTDTGILRVYSGCCHTPVAHVPSPKLAFVGIPHAFTQYGSVPAERDRLFGPLIHRLQGRFCHGELPAGAHLSTPLHLQLGASVRLFWDTLRGLHKPSPFHDGNTPKVAPRVLAASELEQLRQHVPTPSPLAQPRFARSCS